MPAQPLTPEQKSDAERLRAVYYAWKVREKAEGRPANQSHIASLLGIQQSAFSQYCNGDIPLNVNVLSKLKEAVGFDPDSISPVLAQEMARLASAVDSIENRDHAPVHLVDAKASAGKGQIVFSEDATKVLMFRRDWLAKNDAKADSTIAFEVDGDSMVDMHITHKSVVLANRRRTEPISKRIYVVWLNGHLYVKQLIKSEGVWWARSRNVAKVADYPDILIDDPSARIVGRAFWCGFGL